MKREEFEQVLPGGFRAEICSFLLGSEDKFECTLRLSVRNDSEWDVWLQEFSNKSKTNWITSATRPGVSRFSFLKKYECHHSSRNKTSEYTTHSELKRKNTNCDSKLKITIKKDTADTRKRDPFVKAGLLGLLEISWSHNHSIDSAHAMSFLAPSEETRENFENMFSDSLSAAEALNLHRAKLFDSENSEELLADDVVNSKNATVLVQEVETGQVRGRRRSKQDTSAS